MQRLRRDQVNLAGRDDPGGVRRRRCLDDIKAEVVEQPRGVTA